MKLNYKLLGEYIKPVVGRNNDLGNLPLVGLSIQKKFIPSIANIIGTDMSTYKIIEKNQFAFGPVTSRNGDKITIALFKDYEKALISQAYIPFEVKDENKLDPEYLMMWFRRPEFDRYARFKSHGSAREIFDWEEMCNTLLPVPSITKQKQIVKEYNIIQNRIDLNQQLINKIEQTAQSIFKAWFVDFEFPDENGKPYKSNGGIMSWNEGLEKEVPDGWEFLLLSSKVNYKYGKNLPTDKLLKSGYNVYGGNGIIGYIDKYIYNKPQVMVSCRGAASGKIIIADEFCFITNNSIVFEYTSNFEFCFLRDYALNNSFEEFVTGSAQPQITIESLEEIRLLWPSEEVLINHQSIITPIYTYHSNVIQINKVLLKLKELLLSKLSTIEN